MVLALVGASHHDVPLERIEQITHAGSALARTLITSDEAVRGAFVLSTCNRYEVYLDLARFHDALELTTAAIAQASGLSQQEVADSVRVTVGNGVAQHLFSVAAGLESMIVGEDEIAGQVREALATAQAEGTTSPTIERVLQRALATSKAVTSSTGLGAAGRSVVTVGLDIAEQRHGSMAGKRALVLGTGAYARVVIGALSKRGVDSIHVYSSSGRAERFADAHEVTAVEDLSAELAAADLVAACSGAPDALIDVEHLGAMRACVLPIIDLALSPDVAPAARERADVDLIDLEVIREHAPAEHLSAVMEAQDIVRGAVECFERSETGRAADPAVVAMRAYVNGIINEEIERATRRLGEESAQEIARSLNRVSNALLHTPSIRAQELARTGDFADYRKAMHTLFGIDVESTPSSEA